MIVDDRFRLWTGSGVLARSGWEGGGAGLKGENVQGFGASIGGTKSLRGVFLRDQSGPREGSNRRRIVNREDSTSGRKKDSEYNETNLRLTNEAAPNEVQILEGGFSFRERRK